LDNLAGDGHDIDQWIDAVDGTVRRQLGRDVRTEEISWDSAMWVG